LRGLDVWIVDALRDRPHPSHAHLEMALGWIDRIRPERSYLTHMNHEVDYADWASRLPTGVLPAHDGLVLEVGG
jgi:phosphoribosyl 1,2-cyclic phosphate phosphodiesterase